MITMTIVILSNCWSNFLAILSNIWSWLIRYHHNYKKLTTIISIITVMVGIMSRWWRHNSLFRINDLCLRHLADMAFVASITSSILKIGKWNNMSGYPYMVSNDLEWLNHFFVPFWLLLSENRCITKSLWDV